ncbi:uncharacterized protein L203_106226 [Cryptococcus depauperatus CBS 7841]|uniref:Zn(2)-C6 fungal-type domain-containing protein n=1 Tax=Cryptococcus depauperatus CBS 7841 TaxID=1295531 RepID=A0AAJ8JYM0_9TREE
MALSIKDSRLYYLSFASTVYLDFSTEQSPVDANAQSVTARDANVSKSTDHSQKSCQTTIDLKRQNLLASISKNETQLVHLCDCRPLPAISSNSQFLTTFPLIQISTTRFCPRPFSVRMSDLPNPALFTSLTRLPAPPTYARLYDRPVSPSIGDTPPVTLKPMLHKKPGDRSGQAKLAIDESCAINARSNRKPVLTILPAKSKRGLAAGGSRLRNVAACNQCRKQQSRCNGNSQMQEPCTRCSQMGKFCIHRNNMWQSNSYSQLLNNQDPDFEIYDPQQLDCLQPYLHLGIYQPGSSDALNQKYWQTDSQQLDCQALRAHRQDIQLLDSQ